MYIKSFTLALALAIGITAFAGAGTAVADRLCEENVAVCPVGKTYAANTVYKAELQEGTVAKFEGGVAIECLESTAEIETLTKGGAKGVKIIGELFTLTFNTCNNCQKIESQALNWQAELGFVKGVPNEGQLTIKKPQILLEKCKVGMFTVTCTAKAEVGDQSQLKFLGGNEGGVAAQIKAEKIPFSLGICGKGTFTATYDIKTPATPIWVTEA